MIRGPFTVVVVPHAQFHTHTRTKIPTSYPSPHKLNTSPPRQQSGTNLDGAKTPRSVQNPRSGNFRVWSSGHHHSMALFFPVHPPPHTPTAPTKANAAMHAIPNASPPATIVA